MKGMGNKYEIDSDKLLSIANDNVIDREFSETLKIKIPKSIYKDWKRTKKRFETGT